MVDRVDRVDRDGYYKTTDTALAAYLRVEGIKLLGVDTETYPAVFIFESAPQIAEYKRQWECGVAEGNLKGFFISYRQCLKMVKAGK